MLDLEKMKAAAEGATQGEWVRSGVRMKLGDDDCLRVGPDGFALAFLPIGHRPQEQAGALRDAAHIAAWSPANAKAVLARLEAAEARADRAEGALRCADSVVEAAIEMVWPGIVRNWSEGPADDLRAAVAAFQIETGAAKEEGALPQARTALAGASDDQS